MGLKGKKASMPSAPDYTALAKQQSELSKQAAEWALGQNRVDQSNPLGSSTWTQDPTTGKWSQSTTLNQPQQDLLNAQTQNQQDIAGALSSALKGYDTSQVDFSGAPAAPTVGGYNQQVIDTINQLQAPQLQRQRAAQEAKMAAMGLGTGSGQAWNTQQNLIGQNENDANLKAILAGIQQGNVEFGQGMDLRNQGVNEILKQKQANLGQLSGLMGLTQQQQMPQFANYAQTGAYQIPDLVGAAKANYDAQVAQANAKNASGGGLLGTLGGIAGTALGSMAGPLGASIGGSLGSSIFGGGGGLTPAQSASFASTNPNGYSW